MLRVRARALAGSIVLLTVLGCSGGDSQDTADPPTTGPTVTSVDGTDEATTTTSLLDEPVVTPIGDGSDEPVRSDDFRRNDPALLTDVRLAGQDGFDRIVFEFEDASTGFWVRYAAPPFREDGPGFLVDIDGEAFVAITMAYASSVDLSSEQPRQTYTGPERLRAASTGVVVEAVQTGDFEATLTWVVGLGERVPFAVERLEEPSRLVVDFLGP